MNRTKIVDKEITREVQVFLAQIGLYKGEVDGVHTPELSKAIIIFKKAANLNVKKDFADKITQTLLTTIREYAKLIKTKKEQENGKEE